MNIIDEDESNRGVSHTFTKRNVLLLFVSIIVSIVGWVLFTDYGPMFSLAILLTVSVIVAESWNRELIEDTYAPLGQFYISYLGAFIITISTIIFVVQYYSIVISVVVGIFLGFVSISIISSVALRGLDQDEYEFVSKTDYGGAVVYLKNGDYISHVEKVAEKNKSEPEEKES